MLYLIMPIVLLMVIQNDSDATTKNTIAIYPAEDTAATFRDNKKKRLHLLSWSNSDLDTICEDNDKAYSITPMLNLMFINLTPLRNKC
jgi:hypothetical protein